MVLRVVAFVLSLGLDTLVVAASLGARERAAVARTALAFAGAEALMPLVGVAVGHVAGQVVGRWASLAGGLMLVGLALWMTVLEPRDEPATPAAADGEPEPGAAVGHTLAGWPLVAAALGVSLDELAAGFSIALVGVPVALTVALIALQSFVLTLVGMRFGNQLRPYLGESAERAAGVVLGLLGLWILLGAVAAGAR